MRDRLAQLASPFDALEGGACGCHKCLEGKTVMGLPVASMMMVLCAKCGNKRCPHATDHDLACTGSNAPGQKGSVFE